MSHDESLLTTEDYERAAKKVLPRMVYDYIRSGADEEATLKANRKAFRRFQIWYRVLVDVSDVDLTSEVIGTTVAFPILVSPTAFHKLANHEGEPGTARGATEAGTIFTLSTLSTTSLEDVAAAATGPKWFQLYVHSDRGFTKSLLERAEASGYRAIVLTVDVPVLGRRLADERNQFTLPEGLRMENYAQYADQVSDTEGGSTLAAFFESNHDASFAWADIEWLRSVTSLPIVIKGLVRADDAVRAVESGAAGVVVSNHGGRQLDGAPATIEALPEVVEAIAGRCEVLMDGGIRYGTDVLKALALGAKAVMVGRPVIWGLAVGGSTGVQRVLEILRDELGMAMTLAGCRDLDSIDSSLVRRSKP